MQERLGWGTHAQAPCSRCHTCVGVELGQAGHRDSARPERARGQQQQVTLPARPEAMDLPIDGVEVDEASDI